MSLPSGNLEDAAKQRPKDSKMRREELDNPQPEGKRLKLGNEEGHLRKEGEEDREKSHLGREESGTQTDGEGQTDMLGKKVNMSQNFTIPLSSPIFSVKLGCFFSPFMFLPLLFSIYLGVNKKDYSIQGIRAALANSAADTKFAILSSLEGDLVLLTPYPYQCVSEMRVASCGINGWCMFWRALQTC
uniref:Uncharacterized protein n=1 Tax=Pseudonaja textilis TaxID=8673 RepID=A0A670YIY4_PSETE